MTDDTDYDSIRAQVLYTWVPKNQSGLELTVVAGNIVEIINNSLHTNSIRNSISDCELIYVNNNSNNNATSTLALDPTSTSKQRDDKNEADEKAIAYDGIHWTLISTRKKQQGYVPSLLLSYDTNP